MSKKVKEVRSSVSTSTSKVKEAIKPSPRMKMVWDTKTGFIKRVEE